MENGAATDFCMRHQMMLCKGGLLFSFCSTLPTPHLGTTEGQSGREMETERKTEICGRAVSSAEQWKHLRVSQTFYTYCTQSQQLYNTRLKDEKLFWMQWFKVLSFAIVTGAALQSSNSVCEKGWHDWHKVYCLLLTVLFWVSESVMEQSIYCYICLHNAYI